MTAMRDRAAVGTVWQLRRDRSLWVIVMSHRVDRLAELLPLERTNASHEEKAWVRFADLRRKYEEVQP